MKDLTPRREDLEPIETASRDEIAFWLYSSGSTGRPKGTVHAHGNLFATAASYGAQVLRLEEGDVTFSAAKLFFAYGLGNALTFPLSVGATVVLMAERPTPEAVFRRLVERYPASEYAPDAQQRMVYLKNRLAAYENQVADYYLRRGAYVAAATRARNALQAFNGADSNAESLRIMIEAYEGLGMNELAADTRRVRDDNFPSGD